MLLLILLYIKNNRILKLWQPFILFAVRSGLWIYMISTARYPARITHSLYFIELVLIIGLIINQANKERKAGRLMITILVFMMFGMLSVSVFGINYQNVKQESAIRDKANEEMQSLIDYCKANPDNFYFIDVYSFCSSMKDHVEYSEKIFEKVDNSLANYDYLGGWIMNSPHTDKKLDNFGIPEGKDRIEDAITDCNNCYVVIRADRDTDWITEYYSMTTGVSPNVEKVDEIGDTFGIYVIR